MKGLSTDIEKGYIQSALRKLAIAHFNLLAKDKPFYGNDVMKIFMINLVEFPDYNM